MSLVTRCPACQTLFRVVSDQLRISDGWVRCGQCNEIFDASSHLQSAPLIDSAAFQATPQSEVVPTSDNQTIGSAETVVEEVPPNQDVEPVNHSVKSIETEGAPLGVQSVAPPLDRSDEDVPPLRAQSRGDDEDLRAPLVTQDVEQSAPALLVPSQSEEQPAVAAVVSFMRRADQPSPWHRRGVRVSLALLGLVLGLGLIAQVVVHQRDRIAALQPASRPMLLALCGVLGCEVRPLMQIESIMIDNSSFTKIRGEAYRLNFALRNAASTVLALPALELTLTDTQDRAILRRVFLPAELGASATQFAAGEEWAASLAVNLHVNGSADRIAGYRLLAFYP